MASSSYDFLVIGAGAAGSNAVDHALRAGRRVALVERDELGGTCLNYGCDPTKTLLDVAMRRHEALDGKRFGLKIPEVEVDWPAVQAHVRAVQREIRGGTPAQARKAMAARDNLDLIIGEARFVSPHEVRVGRRTLRADKILIATGSEAVVPPIEGLEETGYLTNRTLFDIPELPKRLAVIGAGPVGIEFAQLFARLGVEVTVLDSSPRPLMRDDPELAEALCDHLCGREGIRLVMGVNVQKARCRGTARGKVLSLSQAKQVVVDEILLATGRRPMLEGLDVEQAGLTLDDEGRLRVDETLQTTVPHIWVAGDAGSPYQFSNVAAAQGELAYRNAFSRTPQPFYDSLIPWVTYTDPALAHAGPTEEELDKKGITYQVARLPLAEIDRARILRQTVGEVKLLIGYRGKVLAGHILAADAGEMIAPVILAIKHGLTADDLATTMLPYPTLTDAVRWAANNGKSKGKRQKAQVKNNDKDAN